RRVLFRSRRGGNRREGRSGGWSLRHYPLLTRSIAMLTERSRDTSALAVVKVQLERTVSPLHLSPSASLCNASAEKQPHGPTHAGMNCRTMCRVVGEEESLPARKMGCYLPLSPSTHHKRLVPDF